MSKAIDDLKDEHEAILSALEILDGIVSRIESGTRVDARDLTDFTGFLVEFADKCHHGKEEGILFPALAKAGLKQEGGPVGVMLVEHAKGRGLVGDMRNAMSKTESHTRFAAHAMEYSNLLRNHIQKENDVLFPEAERLLSDAQLDRIYSSFEEHEEKVIGQGRHEELHRMLHELKEKYGDV